MALRNEVSLTECSRDAMQGWPHPIATATKVAYIKQLMSVGFDVLDMGSFVSPRAIPQMADTEEVLQELLGIKTRSKLLCIVANEQGMERAQDQNLVDIVGYPFSISETFQRRNANASIRQSLERLDRISKMASDSGKELVVYLSMGFGNPYGDPWSPQIVMDWANRLSDRYSIRTLSLSDTTGSADSQTVSRLFESLQIRLPDVPLGVHLHTLPKDAKAKVEAAYRAGCRHFEGAINGIGGCPMAADELTGNMATETLIASLTDLDAQLAIDQVAFNEAFAQVSQTFL